MELHRVPRTTEGTWVRVLEDQDGPPGALGFKAGDLILYFHIDGIYSYAKNRAGQLVHLRAWADVEVVGKVGEKDE